MKSFIVSCLLAASAFAINTKPTGHIPAIPIGERPAIEDNVLERVRSGIFELVDEENDLNIDVHTTLLPVETIEEQAEAVAEQLEEGFSELKELNKERSKDNLETAQEKQMEKIEAIIDEKHEEAVEAILEAEDSEEEEAAEEKAEEVMDEAKEEIEKVNEEHDEEVKEQAEATFVAEIKNDEIKENILRELMGEDMINGNINEVIRRQHLPFRVSTPGLRGDNEAPNCKLNRMLSANDQCMEKTKQDPEFDSFLMDMLSGFGNDRRRNRAGKFRF